uniref:Uncharacterized protein n=1 Tax=Glossina pallidipes TaxID=7398 RepID=A0A1A9ZB89_GLOPL
MKVTSNPHFNNICTKSSCKLRGGCVSKSSSNMFSGADQRRFRDIETSRGCCCCALLSVDSLEVGLWLLFAYQGSLTVAENVKFGEYSVNPTGTDGASAIIELVGLCKLLCFEGIKLVFTIGVRAGL